MRDCLQIAFSPPVRRRALRMVGVVGAALLAINHGGAILHGEISRGRLIQILLTLCVPYAVSTYSSVAAIRDSQRGKGHKGLQGLQGREGQPEPESV